MAITTQGHRLSNLPRYTPVDPSLVAFNPSAATSGIMDALKVGATLDKIRAERAAQAELAATRPTRVGATIAQDKLLEAIATKRLPNVSDQAATEAAELLARRALAGETTALSPVRTEAETARYKGIAKATPFITDAQIAKAQEDIGLSPYRVKAQKAQLGSIAEITPFTTEAQIAAAKRGTARDTRGTGIDPIMEDFALADAYYGNQAKSLAPQLTLANIGKTAAEAGLAQANADYIASGARTQDRSIQELAALNMDIKRSNEAMVANPEEPGKQMSLAAYESEFGHPARPVDNRWLTSWRDPIKRNPEADLALIERDRKARIATDITRKLASKRGVEGDEDVTPQVRASGGEKRYSPEEASKLPKGTVFIGIDGVKRVVK